jgi:hypothetical protein
MVEPAVGIRGKIGVFCKNVLRADILLQLHEVTFFANFYVERMK